MYTVCKLARQPVHKKGAEQLKIDGNEIEKAAMAQFHKGNRKEGLRIQEQGYYYNYKMRTLRQEFIHLMGIQP